MTQKISLWVFFGDDMLQDILNASHAIVHEAYDQQLEGKHRLRLTPSGSHFSTALQMLQDRGILIYAPHSDGTEFFAGEKLRELAEELGF